KDATRKRLTSEEVDGYVESCLPMIRPLLLEDRLEIRRNSEWLGSMGMANVLELTAQVTVSRLMDREDFSKRFKENEPISLIEFMYPILQGQDSVAIRADVEIGGNDQLLNLLMGRDLQERAGQRPQSVATVPLLVGTDGVKKMSQSLGNYISVRDDASEMFGKTMSIPDELMPQWFRLAAAANQDEVRSISSALAEGELHPGDTKRDLARRIVERFHGAGSGTDAEAAFDRIFKEKDTPDEVPLGQLPDDAEIWLPKLLASEGLAASNGEARRLIEQGAVRIAGERITSETVDRSTLSGATVQVGKRRFIRFD
ncbi:MAG: tyrosine--tRNA ligase, partial [Actinomycetota bacterium]